MRPARLPALVVLLWLAATLLWWAVAFMPLPSEPPEWLTAARAACFGSAESGLPAAYGWMLLVLAPASFLVGIVVLWGADLRPSVLQAARTGLGRCVILVVAGLVVTEGAWVAAKVHAARAVVTWAGEERDDGPLPAGYPRRVEAAPAFVLVDQHARQVSLERFRGRPVVLTFVFAHCQTMCPLIVENLKRAATPDSGSEVLLVTLDPWRDTPSSLPGLASQWQLPEHFHVLSSRSVPEVLRVVEAYGVPFERNETSGDITHPGLVFLIDPRGQLAYTFNNPSPTWVRDGLTRLGPAHASRG